MSGFRAKRADAVGAVDKTTTKKLWVKSQCRGHGQDKSGKQFHIEDQGSAKKE